ncbi:MAG: hypothetical protein ACRC6E_11575, partial [Fusobacteriaceae bacterium]
MKIYVAKTSNGYIKSWTKKYNSEHDEYTLLIKETGGIPEAHLFTDETIPEFISTILEWGLGLD